MSFSKENQDLLKEKVTTESAAPRRNTKKDLIEKIKTLCEEHNLPLTESDTTLARSSKTQLQQMLAAKTEAVIQKKMMDSVSLEQATENNHMREFMAVATLNYGLVTLNRILDRGSNMVLPRFGYQLDGFLEKWEDPRTAKEVKEILTLIVRENPDMIQHISNPYIRLALVYMGTVSMSLKKTNNINNGTIQNRHAAGTKTIRTDDGRKSAPREKLPEQPHLSNPGR